MHTKAFLLCLIEGQVICDSNYLRFGSIPGVLQLKLNLFDRTFE